MVHPTSAPRPSSSCADVNVNMCASLLSSISADARSTDDDGDGGGGNINGWMVSSNGTTGRHPVLCHLHQIGLAQMVLGGVGHPRDPGARRQ